MNRILLFVTAFVFATGAFAQDTKIIHDENAQNRSVKGFHAVRISHGIDLYITLGNEESVVVSANKTEYRDRIKTEVEDGVLKIYYDKEGFSMDWGNHKMKAYVSAKTLDLINASGGSDVFTKGALDTRKLELQLSGGSDFKGEVKAEELNINQSGGSDVHIDGSVKNLKVHSSGGSDFKGYDLVAETCNIHASGGSDAQVNVSRELTVDASGGSDVYYKGNAVLKDLHSSGSSSVSRRG